MASAADVAVADAGVTPDAQAHPPNAATTGISIPTGRASPSAAPGPIGPTAPYAYAPLFHRDLPRAPSVISGGGVMPALLPGRPIVADMSVTQPLPASAVTAAARDTGIGTSAAAPARVHAVLFCSDIRWAGVASDR